MEKGKLYISKTSGNIIECTEVFEGDYFAGHVVKNGLGTENVYYNQIGYFCEEWSKNAFKEYIQPATSTQIGGNHYKNYKIQPTEFIHANNIPFIEGNIIKYIVRHRSKNGIEDLKKARHYIDLLINFEYESKKSI